MRLLLVTRGYPPRVGGVETLCRQLAEGLAARGDDVTVLTYGGRAPAVERHGGGAPYRVLRLPSRGDVFESSWVVVPELRRQHFDVCHVHNLHASVAAAVWASRRRPYVLTAHYHGGGHTPAARLLHPGYRLLARRIVAGAAAVTAVSRSEAALLRRDFGVDPEVIPNGVDPAPASARNAAERSPAARAKDDSASARNAAERSPAARAKDDSASARNAAKRSPAARAEDDSASARNAAKRSPAARAEDDSDGRPDAVADPPTIAVVSRLVAYKRVDAAVRALADLPEHRLHVVGDGPERGALLALADRLGVRDRLRLTAHRLSDAEVRAALRSAAVHVNLSTAEAFSYTVLDSLAAGTPVVVGGGGALAEWAARFPGAVLTADPDDPGQVAAAVRKLCGLRVDADLGEYALPAILDRYQRLYHRVAGG